MSHRGDWTSLERALWTMLTVKVTGQSWDGIWRDKAKISRISKYVKWRELSIVYPEECWWGGEEYLYIRKIYEVPRQREAKQNRGVTT